MAFYKIDDFCDSVAEIQLFPNKFRKISKKIIKR